MNRDAFLATVIGFVIGIVITSVVLFGPQALKSLPNVTLPRITLPNFAGISSPVSDDQKSEKSDSPITKLTIDSPRPGAIVASETLTVSGRVPGDATIIIGGYADETVAKPDKNGSFQGNVTLTEGRNEITVASVKDGNAETATVEVYFTEEKL